MVCPNCQSDNVKTLEWHQNTQMDRYSAMHTARGVKSPHEAVVKLGLFGVSSAAKLAFSKAYECRSCRNTWRKWFD